MAHLFSYWGYNFKEIIKVHNNYAVRLFLLLIVLATFFPSHAKGQISFFDADSSAHTWVDSTLQSLNDTQKIAQLMIVRIPANYQDSNISEKIIHDRYAEYYGGFCFFAGTTVNEIKLTNVLQKNAKIPLFISMDAEMGVGKRLKDIISLPYSMTMGAISDSTVFYSVGQLIGKQCQRIGVNFFFGPVVDINNNPLNPVIGMRSFGENKYKVSNDADWLMKGLASENILSCIKHFPGHGDVTVDSHLDLPILQKSLNQIDSLELYPFKFLINKEAPAVMVAHLYLPQFDTTPHTPASLSYNIISKLLVDSLHFKGLIVTDGLDMKGITNYFSGGLSSLQSFLAGADILLLPPEIDSSIQLILSAIQEGKISQQVLDDKVRKILLVKYHLGLNHWYPIQEDSVVDQLNNQVDTLNQEIADKALTLVSLQNTLFNKARNKYKELNAQNNVDGDTILEKSDSMLIDSVPPIVFVGIGLDTVDYLTQTLHDALAIPVTLISWQDSLAQENLFQQLHKKDQLVILGIFNYSIKPLNHFKVSPIVDSLLNYYQGDDNILFSFFGNPYLTAYYAQIRNLIVGYESTPYFEKAFLAWLTGQIDAPGQLPVLHNEQ
ncbi:MAG: glycoside hydrolase family 3 N-terminal domain-containing protein [Phycisphaerales bacterium]|nr:glycoside hydrolase family 3 N-terminal domain-containing protein [Phycisphaerales bacterium]